MKKGSIRNTWKKFIDFRKLQKLYNFLIFCFKVRVGGDFDKNETAKNI